MSDPNQSIDYQRGYSQAIRDIWIILMDLADYNAQNIESKVNKLKEFLRNQGG